MKMTSQKVLIGGLLVAVAAAGVLWFAQQKKPAVQTQPTGAATQPPAVRKSDAAVPGRPVEVAGKTLAVTNQQITATEKRMAETEKPTEAPKTAEQLQAEKMRELYDNGDEAAALALARQLMKSADPAVRSEVVEMLSWIGVSGLPELTMMLADQDEEVAQDALDKWQTMIAEIEDETKKGELLKFAMTSLKDADDLEFLSMEFNNLEPYIAVMNLVPLIQSSNPAAAKIAREIYKDITDKDFTTEPDAQAWIQENKDPDAK